MLVFFREWMTKAHVHGHYRRTKSGKMVWVESYDNKSKSAHAFSSFDSHHARAKHVLSSLMRLPAVRNHHAAKAFHGLDVEGTKHLAKLMGLHKYGADLDAEYASRKDLMESISGAISAKSKALEAGRIAARQRVNAKKTTEVSNGKPEQQIDDDGGMDVGGTGTVEPVNTAEQPYATDGLKLSRGSLTGKPTAEALPDGLAGQLRPHQRDACNLALEQYGKGHRSFLIADGTGAGKTMQALATAEAYRLKHPGKPVLIVTANARVIDQAFAGDASKLGLSVSPVKDLSEVSGDGIHITTYTALSAGKFGGMQPGLLILDEAHNLKNFSSKKTKAGSNLLKAADHSLLLTATPADKGEHVGYLATAFGFNFVKTMGALGYEQDTKYGGFKLKYGISQSDAIDRMSGLFDDLTHRGLMVKREVSMDKVKVGTKTVKLDPDTAASMAKAWTDMNDSVSKAPPQQRGLAKMLGLGKLRSILETQKIDAAVEGVQSDLKAGRQSIVFANRFNDSELPDWADSDLKDSLSGAGALDAVADKLEAQGVKVARLYGKHLKQAKKSIEAFQSGAVQVAVMTPQAGGTGLSLDDTTGTAPRGMTVMTAPFSALEAVQMVGRINRLTTKSNGFVRFLSVDHPVDAWNMDIIRAKLHTLGASVQGDVADLDLDHLSFLSDDAIQEMGITGIPKASTFKVDLDALGLRDPNQPKAAPASKTYLAVPYDDREFAKKHGARWDADRRLWYVSGDIPGALEKYKPAEKPESAAPKPKVFLKVPYDDKDFAKKYGARWDSEKRLWYVHGDVPPQLHKYAGSAATAAHAMTPDKIKATAKALDRVNSMCDGAHSQDGCGFNRMDAQKARHYLTLGENMPPEVAYDAMQMVRKYRGQYGDSLHEQMGLTKSLIIFRKPRSGLVCLH